MQWLKNASKINIVWEKNKRKSVTRQQTYKWIHVKYPGVFFLKGQAMSETVFLDVIYNNVQCFHLENKNEYGTVHYPL